MDHLIVVLNYNKPTLTEWRADELARLYGGNPLVSFLLFDNGSTDPAMRLVRASLEGRGIPTAFVRDNLGFGRGMNAAVCVSREMMGAGDRTVLHLLSNDVSLRGDFATPVGQALANMPEAVATHRIIDWPAGWNQFANQVIRYPEGYYLGMPMATWDLLGGFDEDFHPYDYEDIDLGYRCQLAGIPLVPLTFLPMAHTPASTLGYTAERREQTLRMRRLFCEKHGLPLVPEAP